MLEYTTQRKFNNHSGDIKPLGVLKKINGCITESNLEGQGW